MMSAFHGFWRVRGTFGTVEIEVHPKSHDPQVVADSVSRLQKLLFDFRQGQSEVRRVLLEVYGRLQRMPRQAAARASTDAAAESLQTAAKSGQLVVRPVAHRHVVVPLTQELPALGPETTTEPDDWIGLVLVNQDGQPVPNRSYRVITPDKVTIDGMLDGKGSARVDAIKSGSCKVYCPYIESHGDVTHVVEPGQHASGIAQTYGYDDLDQVWQHPKNAELRQKRDNPHVLQPGDEIFVPDASTVVPPVDKPTGQKHKFTIKQSPLKLRMKLMTPKKDQPLANAVCTLGGKKLTTDGDGIVEVPVDKLNESSVLSVDGTDIKLRLGHLNPMDDASLAGWKARLYNMGFLYDPEIEDEDQEVAFAISDFQAEHDLDVSGHLDDATKAKIKEVYGC